MMYFYFLYHLRDAFIRNFCLTRIYQNYSYNQYIYTVFFSKFAHLILYRFKFFSTMNEELSADD